MLGFAIRLLIKTAVGLGYTYEGKCSENNLLCVTVKHTPEADYVPMVLWIAIAHNLLVF